MAIEERPLIFASHASLTYTPDDVPVFNSISSFDILKKTLEDKLREYNESNAVMELVLFQQVGGKITHSGSRSSIEGFVILPVDSAHSRGGLQVVTIHIRHQQVQHQAVRAD